MNSTDNSPTQNFCLKWNQFHDNLASSLHQMKDSCYLTDVTLISEEGSRHQAHRVMLASSSSFFSEIFSFDDVSKPWIYMKGVSSQLLESLMMFIYQGEVEIQADQLTPFMEMAGDMKIRGLTKYAASLAVDDIVVPGVPGNSEIVHDEVHDDLTPSDSINDDDIIIDDTEEKHFASDNIIEVHAELDKQIEEILVKNNGMWHCKVCGKFANHKSKLKQHVETHIQGFSHPCPICGKSYRSRNVLRMHLSRDHRNKKISPSKQLQNMPQQQLL